MERYGLSGDVHLHKDLGETWGHVHMKLLSYLLFYHPELQIEVDADQHYKPDLLRKDERGNALQWIDVGSTSLKKLEKLVTKNKQTSIDIVKRTEKELRAYQQQAVRRLQKSADRARFFTFDDGFLSQIEPHLQGRHDVTATITGSLEHLYLDVDGVSFETRIIQL